MSKFKYKLTTKGKASDLSYADQDIEGFEIIETDQFPDINELHQEPYKSQRLYDDLRTERNKLLRESDFTQLPDYDIEEGKKTKWKIYRQSLRDLPGNTSNPSNPVWPEKPL